MGETRCFFYCGCYSGDRGSQSFLRMPRKMGQSVRCIQFSKVLTPRLLLCISKGSSRLDCLETWTKMVCKWQFYSFPASSQRNCLPHKSSGVLPTPTPIPCHPRAPSTSICSTIYHTASYLLDPSPPPPHLPLAIVNHTLHIFGYSLDPECPPRTHMWKVQCPAHDTLERW